MSGADAGIQVAHESGHSKNDLRLISNIDREVVGVANYQSVVVGLADRWHCGFYSVVVVATAELERVLPSGATTGACADTEPEKPPRIKPNAIVRSTLNS
jgi:hypothetical protein